MRINEIAEALPGIQLSRKDQRIRERDIQANIDQGVNAWMQRARELAMSGKLDNETPTIRYVSYFLRFMSQVGRIDSTHPKLIEIGDALTRELDYRRARRDERGSIKALRFAIERIVRGRIAGEFKTEPRNDSREQAASPEPKSQTSSPLNSGDTATAGGIEYVWNGSEWRRGDTGEVAPERLAAVLVPNRK